MFRMYLEYSKHPRSCSCSCHYLIMTFWGQITYTKVFYLVFCILACTTMSWRSKTFNTFWSNIPSCYYVWWEICAIETFKHQMLYGGRRYPYSKTFITFLMEFLSFLKLFCPQYIFQGSLSIEVYPCRP